MKIKTKPYCRLYTIEIDLKSNSQVHAHLSSCISMRLRLVGSPYAVPIDQSEASCGCLELGSKLLAPGTHARKPWSHALNNTNTPSKATDLFGKSNTDIVAQAAEASAYSQTPVDINPQPAMYVKVVGKRVLGDTNRCYATDSAAETFKTFRRFEIRLTVLL